ncbi:MAG: hypothetical protein ACLQFF_04330 [Steroidobacteraceae bacterium]|jgi:hypothetical protein
MRDIRPDLLERKEVLLKEIQELEDQAKAKRASLPQLDALIEAEATRWSNGHHQTRSLFEMVAPTDINRFIVDLLSDGKPRSTDEIKEIAVARGVDFEGKAPGRSINIRLVGLARSGQLERQNDNWKLSLA